MGGQLVEFHAQLRHLDVQQNMDGCFQFLPARRSTENGGLGLCRLAARRMGFIRGTMPPGTTVAQGEARAIQVALDRLDPGGVIASDCWAAVCL